MQGVSPRCNGYVCRIKQALVIGFRCGLCEKGGWLTRLELSEKKVLSKG